MNLNNKSIVVTVGYKCNSNCEMCVVGSKNKQNINATTQEVKDILTEGRKNKVDRVEFSGGEPTIRKDLIRLVTFAKKIGYKNIGISTNGILLSNKNYCNKLISAGINIFTVSLHSPNQTINEAITNTPNSFQNTVDGIKNILIHKNVNICVVTVVQKLNFQHLEKIGHLLSSLGIIQWNIVDLSPKGITKEKYASLSVDRKKIINIIIKIVKLFNNLNIHLYNFTHCTVPPSLHKNIITHLNKCNKNNHISYSRNQEFKRLIVKTDSDNTLSKIEICDTCKYSDNCAGYWSDYFDQYGEKDIKKFAIKYNCLE